MVRLTFRCDGIASELSDALQFEFEPKPGRADLLRIQICRSLAHLLHYIEISADASSEDMDKLVTFLSTCKQICREVPKSEAAMQSSTRQFCSVPKSIGIPEQAVVHDASSFPETAKLSAFSSIDSQNSWQSLEGAMSEDISEEEWPSLDSLEADESKPNAEAASQSLAGGETRETLRSLGSRGSSGRRISGSAHLERMQPKDVSDEQSSPISSASSGRSTGAGVKPKIRYLPTLRHYEELPDTSYQNQQHCESEESNAFEELIMTYRSSTEKVRPPSSPQTPSSPMGSSRPGPALRKTKSEPTDRARYFEARFGSRWPGAPLDSCM